MALSERLQRRFELVMEIQGIVETKLTSDEKFVIKELNRVYEDRKNINDPSWSGIHSQSLTEAFLLVPGSEAAWKKQQSLFGLIRDKNPRFSELGSGPEIVTIPINLG